MTAVEIIREIGHQADNFACLLITLAICIGAWRGSSKDGDSK